MKDPVCGMKVDPKRTKFRSEYQGKIYYFCSKVDKNMFDKIPRGYAEEKGDNYDKSK